MLTQGWSTCFPARTAEPVDSTAPLHSVANPAAASRLSNVVDPCLPKANGSPRRVSRTGSPPPPSLRVAVGFATPSHQRRPSSSRWAWSGSVSPVGATWSLRAPRWMSRSDPRQLQALFLARAVPVLGEPLGEEAVEVAVKQPDVLFHTARRALLSAVLADGLQQQGCPLRSLMRTTDRATRRLTRSKASWRATLTFAPTRSAVSRPKPPANTDSRFHSSRGAVPPVSGAMRFSRRSATWSTVRVRQSCL